MNELISLTQSAINGELQQTVNARELHEFLEVSSRYNDWIRNRISNYEFQENIDYVCLTKTLVTQTEEGREGTSAQKEHFITLDMAKELAMVERNDKGKQARKYFIHPAVKPPLLRGGYKAVHSGVACSSIYWRNTSILAPPQLPAK